MNSYYILKGHEVVPVASVEEWAVWFESADRRVAHEELLGKRIFTTFLGLDHRYHGGGTPLVFETMVFPMDNYSDEYCERCSTWEEAEAQHQRAIEWVKAASISISTESS